MSRAAHRTVTAYGRSSTVPYGDGNCRRRAVLQKIKFRRLRYGEDTAQNGRITVYGMMGVRIFDTTCVFIAEGINKRVHSLIVAASWLFITLRPDSWVMVCLCS